MTPVQKVQQLKRTCGEFLAQSGAVMTTKLEWKELWDAMDAHPEAWIETTEGMYHEMLGCLPPRAMWAGKFLVGEPLRHVNGEAVHACFWEKPDGSTWARNLTVEQFRLL